MSHATATKYCVQLYVYAQITVQLYAPSATNYSCTAVESHTHLQDS